MQKLAITVHQLRGMLGISSKLWDEAQRSLGAVDASLDRIQAEVMTQLRRVKPDVSLQASAH